MPFDCDNLQFMGGVDLLDRRLSLYRIHIRSKKWYDKLLYHFFAIAVVQSWLLYLRDLMFLSILETEWMPLRSFKMSIANSNEIEWRNTKKNKFVW